MELPQVTVLGVGNILLTDEGFGVRVVEALYERYRFPQNLSLVDGNVMGLNLLGIISGADHLIVVDAVKNKGTPGTLYRLAGDDIPRRILAKNSLHQVDLLETLTLCRVLDKVPHTVILGAEPADIETLGIELTDVLAGQVAPMIERVLAELDRLNIVYTKQKVRKRSYR
jgi:hydrogenase maturation protease